MIACPTCGEDSELSSTTLDDGRRPTNCLACGEKWIRDAAPGFQPKRKPAEPRVVIAASRFDLPSVTERVLARARRFAGRSDPLPWNDLLRINFIGLIGEDAVTMHLQDCGFEVESWAEEWVKGGVEMGDLAVTAGGQQLMVEVKTNGRTARQTRMDRSSSEFIVWCRTSPPTAHDPATWQIDHRGVWLTHWAEASVDWAVGPDQPMSAMSDGLMNPVVRPPVALDDIFRETGGAFNAAE